MERKIGGGSTTFSFSREEAAALADNGMGSVEDITDGRYVCFMTVVGSPFSVRRWPLGKEHLMALGIDATVGEKFLVNEETAGKLYSAGEVRIRFADETRNGITSTLVISVKEASMIQAI